MNLSRYGSACQCLLRLRENQGNPVISDEAFLASRVEAHPEWIERPGAVDVAMIFEISAELGVASGGEWVNVYSRVLTYHRADHAILIRTPAARQHLETIEDRYALVLEMNEDQFCVWQPTPDGYARERTFRVPDDWDDSHSDAIVLYAPAAHSTEAR